MACPPDDAWDELAAGVLTGAPAERLVGHASWCPKCAALLKSSLEVFAPEARVQEMRPVGPRGRRVVVSAVAAAVLLALGIGWWWRNRSSEAMLAQLAEPAAATRTIAMRISGAAHRPYDPLRAAAPPESPAEWLEARARIQRELGSNPDDAGWHAARGRLCLLERDAECALTELKLASDLSGVRTAELLVDWASAYYLRARQNNNPADFTLAIELLSEVLDRERGNLAARFNRALAEEELGLLQPAIEDYEQVAATERDEGWREEARERLDRLKAKRAAVFDTPRPVLEEKFPEEAFDSALGAGLWRGGSELDGLASRMERDHGDRWLARALAVPRTRELERAVSVLAGMARVRATLAVGHYSDLATEFDSLPKLPRPFDEWARFERIYRATHDFRYPCSEPAPPAPREPWLAAQFEREIGLCALRAKNMGEALASARRSEELALRHKLPVSAVRARGILNGLEIRRGRYRESLRLAQSGFRDIAELGLPAARLRQFVSGVVLASANLGRLHAARRAAKFSATLGDPASEGSAGFNGLAYWAALAQRTGDAAEAWEAYEAALSLWKRSQGNAAPPEWRAWAEANLAGANGDLVRVASFEPMILSSKDERVRGEYRLLLAELKMAARDWAGASGQLRQLLASDVAGRGRDPVFRYQERLATRRLMEALIEQKRPEEALAIWRQRDSAPVDGTAYTIAALGKRIGVWRRERGVTEFRWCAADVDGYQRMARRLLALASRRESSEEAVSSSASELGAALFGGWLRRPQRGTRSYFIPDPDLIEIPFGLLPGRKEPIGAEQAIAIGGVEEEAGNAGGALAVDASSAPGLGRRRLAPLEPAREEMEAVAGLRPGGAVLSGRDASAGRMLEALPGAGLLHFAGHASPQEDGAALVLHPDSNHPDGLVTLTRLGARIPRTVVLSACSTARRAQEEIDTESPLSLARVILAQGSGQVVASYWDVGSGASASFMTQFYASLRRDQDAGIAMRTAVRGLRADSRYRHPYYWGVYARWIK